MKVDAASWIAVGNFAGRCGSKNRSVCHQTDNQAGGTRRCCSFCTVHLLLCDGAPPETGRTDSLLTAIPCTFCFATVCPGTLEHRRWSPGRTRHQHSSATKATKLVRTQVELCVYFMLTTTGRWREDILHASTLIKSLLSKSYDNHREAQRHIRSLLDAEKKFFWPQFNSVNQSLTKRQFVRDLTSYHYNNGVFNLQTKPNGDGDGLITLRAPRPSDTEKRHQYSVRASQSQSPRRSNRPHEGHTRERSPYQQRHDRAPYPFPHGTQQQPHPGPQQRRDTAPSCKAHRFILLQPHHVIQQRRNTAPSLQAHPTTNQQQQPHPGLQQRRITVLKLHVHRPTTSQQQRQLSSVQHEFAQGIQSSQRPIQQSSQESSQQPIDSDTVHHLTSRHQQDHSTQFRTLREGSQDI